MHDKQVKLFRYCAGTNCTECAVAGCPGPQKFLKEAADAIEELIEVIQNHDFLESLIKPPWIPVEERLPNKDEALDVMCWLREGYCVTGSYNPITQKWVPDAEFANPNSVTHWMPAPQGPKSSKEEA